MRVSQLRKQFGDFAFFARGDEDVDMGLPQQANRVVKEEHIGRMDNIDDDPPIHGDGTCSPVFACPL